MSYTINNKQITKHIINQDTNQKGGSLETLSVPLGLLLMNQYLPTNTSKNIYDIQTHNYIKEDSANMKCSVSEEIDDSINENLYDKLLNILNVSKEKKEKTKTRKKRKQIKIKNRVTKKIY